MLTASTFLARPVKPKENGAGRSFEVVDCVHHSCGPPRACVMTYLQSQAKSSKIFWLIITMHLRKQFYLPVEPFSPPVGLWTNSGIPLIKCQIIIWNVSISSEMIESHFLTVYSKDKVADSRRLAICEIFVYTIFGESNFAQFSLKKRIHSCLIVPELCRFDTKNWLPFNLCPP